MIDYIITAALIDRSQAIHDRSTPGKAQRWGVAADWNVIAIDGHDPYTFITGPVVAFCDSTVNKDANVTAIAHAHNLHAALLATARKLNEHRAYVKIAVDSKTVNTIEQARAERELRELDAILQPLDEYAWEWNPSTVGKPRLQRHGDGT